MKIKDNAGLEVSQTATLARYFRKPDETTAQFALGLKALSPTDKEELARDAAKELGFTVEA